MMNIICGEIPGGLTICGWILKTNANANYHDVVAKWERKKNRNYWKRMF